MGPCGQYELIQNQTMKLLTEINPLFYLTTMAEQNQAQGPVGVVQWKEPDLRPEGEEQCAVAVHERDLAGEE